MYSLTRLSAGGGQIILDDDSKWGDFVGAILVLVVLARCGIAGEGVHHVLSLWAAVPSGEVVILACLVNRNEGVVGTGPLRRSRSELGLVTGEPRPGCRHDQSS